MHSHWYIMTATMPICLAVCISLIILQTKSINHCNKSSRFLKKHESEIFSKKTELFCLFGQYIIGGICAIQCFLCHLSNYFPSFYCIYGMSICVILYAATKACLYGFFLERAKCAQSIATMLPLYIWRFIFPAYILIYFLVYFILCPLTFRGAVIDPMINNNVPTACLFGEYHSWIFTLSAFVDIFNSILFGGLFMWPLYETLKTREELRMSDITESSQKSEKTEDENNLYQVIKYNIVCSTICSISSVTFLFVMSFSNSGSIGYYLWLGGNIDIMINSICLFLMLGSNRAYLWYLYSKYVKIAKNTNTNLEMKRSVCTESKIDINTQDTNKCSSNTLSPQVMLENHVESQCDPPPIKLMMQITKSMTSTADSAINGEENNNNNNNIDSVETVLEHVKNSDNEKCVD